MSTINLELQVRMAWWLRPLIWCLVQLVRVELLDGETAIRWVEACAERGFTVETSK